MSELELEKEHVHKVYSEIAAHFSDTRFKPWPRIAKFLEDQSFGSLIADVGKLTCCSCSMLVMLTIFTYHCTLFLSEGCGNGKYLGVNPGISILGSDICPELVSIGRSRGHEVIVSDCLNLPYRSNLFDGLICIAVIHHLSTEVRRQAAIKEMVRVLHPGGTMLIYVWAMEQERKKVRVQTMQSCVKIHICYLLSQHFFILM